MNKAVANTSHDLGAILLDPHAHPSRDELFAVAELIFDRNAVCLSRADQRELFKCVAQFKTAEHDGDQAASNVFHERLNKFIHNTQRRITREGKREGTATRPPKTAHHSLPPEVHVLNKDITRHGKSIDANIEDINHLKSELALLRAKVQVLYQNLRGKNEDQPDIT